MPERFKEEDAIDLAQLAATREAAEERLGPVAPTAGLATQRLTLGDKFGMLSQALQLATNAANVLRNVKFRDPTEKQVETLTARLADFVLKHAEDEEV
jgi:hypothetical protein